MPITPAPIAAACFALVSVGLWSFFGYFASRLSMLPSTLMVGVAMIIAGIASLPTARSWRVPWRIHLLGVAGIGGNMLLFFTAFHFAPVVEVNLVNYIWPLLTVLLTPLFIAGSRLRVHHVVGALVGFAGAALVVCNAESSGSGSSPVLGYAICATGAVLWSCYCLYTKRLAAFPSSAVGGFCLSSGILLLAAHACFAPVIEPLRGLSARDWQLLVLCGLGPMGLAYFTWDAAMKRGDPRVIGSLAFFTPLISTLILAVVGGHRIGWPVLVALALIVGGAVIGSLELFRSRSGVYEPPTTASGLPPGP
ncbi:MAG: DMT family transporter [Planctomycetes bacterium]|nr:DMT family transporter [Planctomycetota bacterium]